MDRDESDDGRKMIRAFIKGIEDRKKKKRIDEGSVTGFSTFIGQGGLGSFTDF